MSAITCDLSVFTPEEREQHEALSKELFAAVREVKPLADGYAFRLPEDSAMLFKLAEFICGERQCCPFWTFHVEVEPEGGAIWLSLLGPQGAKALLLPDLRDLLSAEVGADLQ